MKDVTNWFRTRNGLNVSCRTVKRILNQEGNKRCVISKKTTISHVNHERRNRFCRQKLQLTMANHGSSVIFSEETKIMLGNNY